MDCVQVNLRWVNLKFIFHKCEHCWKYNDSSLGARSSIYLQKTGVAQVNIFLIYEIIYISKVNVDEWQTQTIRRR